MEKVPPRPDFGCLTFKYCWCQLFLDAMHEIPVELEEAERSVKGASAFRVVAASPHEVGDSFSHDAVHAFDGVGLDSFAIGVAIHFSTNCRVDFLPVFALDFLAVAEAVFVKIFWEDDDVVVVFG